MQAIKTDNRIRPQIAVLLIVETLAFIVAVHAAAAIRFWGEQTAPASSFVELIPKSISFALILTASMFSLGLYQLSQRLVYKEALARIIVAFVLGLIAITTFWYVVPSLTIGRGITFIAIVLSLILAVLSRFVFLRTIDKNLLRRRSLILGGGKRIDSFQKLRRGSDRRGFQIVATITAGDITPSDDDSEDPSTGCDVLGKTLLAKALETKADEVVIAMDERRGKLPIKALLECRMRGIDVIDIIQFLERETAKIRTDLMDPGWMVFSSGFRVSRMRSITKYLFDSAIAITVLVVLSPVYLLTAIAIKIESGLSSPVFYRQTRIGLFGRGFEVVKFRSMIESAEADGKARWAAEDDPRITAVGHVIRRWRIDELPQMFNVLRGEMSIVGPRPERPEFVGPLIDSIPYYNERHSVKPGITGWAQLRYQYGASENDALEKLFYDLYYVKNHSLLIDVAIMLQTLEVMIWGKGAR